MPPKRSTRASTRNSQKANGDSKAGEQKTSESQQLSQQTLEDTGEGVIDHKAGEKREAPIEIEVNDKESISADDKKDGAPPSKKLKNEAAKKSKIEGGADAIDEKSEDAKAKGREIMENTDDMKRPSRGTLEKGTVYFWYKPKVETEHPENLDDVSKCHMLLLPHTSGSKQSGTPYRLLTFGRKHLPESRDEGAHEVEWGRITAVGDDLKELKDALGASTYETKTRGTRHQPASRCAAQGYYIFRSPEPGEGDDKIKPIEKADEKLPRDFPVYFAYAIAVPEEKDFGDVQAELKIVPRGSFAIQVKNPDAPATNPRAAGSSSGAKEYPPELRGLFTTRFIAANPIELLDYPGNELLFISGRHKDSKAVREEVEKPSEEETKDLEAKDSDQKKDHEEALFEKVFEELNLFKNADDVPGLRALDGEWA